MVRTVRRYSPGDIIKGVEILGRDAGAIWRLRCHCGREFRGQPSRLWASPRPHCGCLTSAIVSARNTKHGHYAGYKSSSLARVYSSMRSRCYNPKYACFADYGGRGISVCQSWLDSLENFVRDMGERPPGMTLDRIDPNGNYEPGNCRWATYAQQNRNKRRTLRAEDGRALKDVAETEGVSYSRLRFFARPGGMTTAEAVAHIRAHPTRYRRCGYKRRTKAEMLAARFV